MGKLNDLKNNVLSKLYGTCSRSLLNSDWKKFRWAINRRKIILWGVNLNTQQYINAFRDKILFIVDENPQNHSTNYSGLEVLSPKVLSEFERNSIVVIILSGTPDTVIPILQKYKQNIFFCPSVMDKSKRLLSAFRLLKKTACVFKTVLRSILLLPYTLFLDKIVDFEDKISYKTLGYKAGNKFSKKSSWKKFIAAQKGKRIVLFGYCKAAEKFIENSKANRIISRCYTFDEQHIGKEYMGLPIISPKLFEFDSHNEVLLIMYSSYNDAQAAVDFVEEQGISKFYCMNSMKAKTFKFNFYKPAYLLRRWFAILSKKNGIYKNFIAFPIKGFLRLCHFPKIYKPYKGLTKYRKKFQGKRCFIVCTGNSLNVKDVERLTNEFTFGVNTIFKIFNQTDWRPTFYCVCDPNFYSNYNKKYTLNFDDFCVERAFVTDYYRKRLKGKNYSRVQYVPINYLDHFCKGENFHYKYSTNLLYGSFNASTVANFCINIAQYMGFSEIYLIGADCSYSVSGSYFDGSKNPMTTSVRASSLVQRCMINGYKFVKKKLDKMGIRVYNATRGGKLEVFPRIDFDSLFPYENMEYDYTLMPDGSRNPVTVSINVLTYMHENYIRKSLDSIIMQSTKFKYEINIGDDASTDRTREIIMEYIEKYPDLFNSVNLYEKNIGSIKNAYNLFINAKGKYIAYLDGDDYWCDPYKLQKQVDFLEYHKEYIGCSAAAVTVDENDNPTNIKQYWDCRKTLFTHKDLDGYSMPSLNQALVHRNIFANTGIDYSFYEQQEHAGDTMTLGFLTCQGDIFRMPEPLFCYRRLTSPQKTNFMSQAFKDKYLCMKPLTVYMELEKFAKKNYNKKLLSITAKRRMISECVIALHKYPNKEYSRKFKMIFWKYPNKAEFISVVVKTYLHGAIKAIKQKKGVTAESQLGLNRNLNLLSECNFALAASVNEDDCIEKDKLPIPKWRRVNLPGENPCIQLVDSGLYLDASTGHVRLRQSFSKDVKKKCWMTLSVGVAQGCAGALRLQFFNDLGELISGTEFVSPESGKTYFYTAKMPKYCKKPSVQIMVQSDSPIILKYAKMEYSKSPTIM